MDEWSILITAVLFMVVGIAASRTKKISLEEYISSRNSFGTLTLAGTIVATAMGAWILFSPAETSVTAGLIALVGYAMGSAFAVFIFIWLGRSIRKIMPQGHTPTEFVLERFGKPMYFTALAIMIFYMAVFLAAELTGIALAANIAFGTPAILTASVIGLATLVYTAIGGLRASIITDALQSILIIPILAVLFIGSILFLGGFSDVFANLADKAPQLLLPSLSGIEYAITLIIAIVGAEIFNQANWQRVYAARDERSLRKGFLVAGFIIFFIILVSGSFGFFAVVTSSESHPSVALFSFLTAVTPRWFLALSMVLATILVMSTVNSLMNGLASLFTVDIRRIYPSLSQKRLLSAARWVTGGIALIAIAVAYFELSVLYLFLIADLVCVAAAFPLLYGLFTSRYSGKTAFISTLIAIAIGGSFFPDPSFQRGNLLLSFGLALLVPMIIALFIRSRTSFDFSKLRRKVRQIQ